MIQGRVYGPQSRGPQSFLVYSDCTRLNAREKRLVVRLTFLGNLDPLLEMRSLLSVTHMSQVENPIATNHQ